MGRGGTRGAEARRLAGRAERACVGALRSGGSQPGARQRLVTAMLGPRGSAPGARHVSDETRSA